MKINDLIPSIPDDFLQQQVERYRNMWGSGAWQDIEQDDEFVTDRDEFPQGDQP